MRKAPPSLTRHSKAWFAVVLLLVVADLAGMMATFMPMKTILILASNDVPSFFPRFLVEGGVVFASLMLLAAAALLGALSWAISRLTERLDKGSLQLTSRTPRFPDWRSDVLQERKKAREFEVSLALTIPVTVTLAVFSLGYLAFSLLWLLISTTGAVWLVSRSQNHAPYVSGVDKVSHELSRWLKTSSLWSMVGLALITLLVAPPALESTAILIAAIFGRRLLTAIADVIPHATLVLSSRSANPLHRAVSSMITHRPTSQLTRWPIEFLASDAGAWRFRRYLSQAGLSGTDFRILGSPTGQALTVVAGSPTDSQLIVRMFGPQHERARQRELARRSHSESTQPFPALESRGVNILGFASIEMRPTSVDEQVDVATTVSREQAIAFQVQQELDSALAFSGESTVPATPLSQSDFITRLQRIGQIPGSHAQPSVELVTTIPKIFDKLKDVPPALVPSRALTANDCYLSISGVVCYLGGHDWTVGHPGDNWGPSSQYEKALDEYEKQNSSVDSSLVQLILLNAELHALNRLLVAFNINALAGAIQTVHRRLSTLD